jgi:hypothetical protein
MTGQLELFPRVEAHEPVGLDRAIARASVSPGWWPLIAALYGAYPGVIVRTCCERDGTLLLDAALADGPLGVESTVRRIRETVTGICGCCGAVGARPYRATLDTPTRVVCPECQARLRAGEAYLRIADDHWHLDGSRRMPSLAVVGRRALQGGAASPAVRRSDVALPPDELRRVIAEIRASMQAEIVGQQEAVARLALLGGLHVGGGLTRGARALVVGASGVGKTSLTSALKRALAPWALPWVETDALDLTAPGWSGAPSIGDLLEAALGAEPPDSPRAQRAVIVIDEIHHAALVPGAHGNMEAKRREVLASLLGLAGYGAVHLGEGARAWSSQHAMVIGMGAFTGRLDPSRSPTVHDLTNAGIPLELSTRLAEEVVLLKPLSEPELVELLHRWAPLTSLVEVCTRLGYTVRIHQATYRRAARVVTLGLDGSTARTAGGWIVSALRRALLDALATRELSDFIIAPDDLPIPPSATRRPPDPPPDDAGGWATPAPR